MGKLNAFLSLNKRYFLQVLNGKRYVFGFQHRIPFSVSQDPAEAKQFSIMGTMVWMVFIELSTVKVTLVKK